MITTNDPGAVVCLCHKIARDTELNEKLSKEALQLHQTLFNPERLQEIFVSEIEKLVHNRTRIELSC